MDFSRLAKRSVKFMVDAIFANGKSCLRWFAAVNAIETDLIENSE
jgi:hypothetical protein